ncbi:hypothetical protein KSZ_03320 [Dictyobacter formicarum]|uniref:Uncharacterized protein n=1 Tax=Dictyobacter formicarum TaxID=2778368 RepID=A0ABQ3V9F0_9CHLR|nr:hypothetical protein KSZ_03320 [Dictyobacter formicarum]
MGAMLDSQTLQLPVTVLIRKAILDVDVRRKNMVLCVSILASKGYSMFLMLVSSSVEIRTPLCVQARHF